MNIRVGFGFDVHRLVEGRDLWMGGIKIDHALGLLGHSDADVLIHAICDALLGAANMRDIGYHFPDTSADTLDIDSKILLRKTVALIATKGYIVGNIDATICAEHPKMNQNIHHSPGPQDAPTHRCHACQRCRRPRHRHRLRGHQSHHHRTPRFHRSRGRHQRIRHRANSQNIIN